MRIETNIKIIEQLSRHGKDANWTFRFFLKGGDVSAARLDSIVHDLYKEVSVQIDCTHCGNCCKVIQPNLSVTDIKRLARQFALTTG